MKGYDQYFLTDHVYQKIFRKSTIHDSFLCNQYQNSKPFPSKRVGNCFVGISGFCNVTGFIIKCPKECRPPEHLDWETC